MTTSHSDRLKTYGMATVHQLTQWNLIIMAHNNVNFEYQLNTFGISLHRAILNQLIGEIENAIANGRIRSQEGKHSVYDFIREILGKKTERQAWSRLIEQVPDIVTFCDFISFVQSSGRLGRKTPVTDMAGLIWIAYTANGEFSYNLRTSSSQLIIAERQNSPAPLTAVESLKKSLDAAHTALNNYPFTLDKLWRDSGIVNKSQVKRAILRDFVEGRDYIWADKLLCVNESTYNILIISFRSLKGADINQLPEIIKLETKKYFQYQFHKKINRRIAQVDDGQLNLFNP